MLNPYLLMTALFMTLAVLGALDNALGLFGVMSSYTGMGWLRVHFITLGAMSEALFGLLPGLAAARKGDGPPETRWDIWLAFNTGLVTLLIGLPLVNAALIITGGTLVFIATAMLINQLANMGPAPPETRSGRGRPFYIAGLGYLLLGILVGTGLYLGWGEVLRIAVPIEVHIHANSWGFMALIFAGLFVDLYLDAVGEDLAWPNSLGAIFWLMVVGELGLVLGPWVGSNYITVPGMILHAAGTIWLLLNIIKTTKRWEVGNWHMVSSYLWFFAPMLVAPFIVAQVPGFPGAGIEDMAPQALIYGWVLQFGYALLPYLFTRVFLPDEEARLGGSWFSLIAVHIGALIYWIGIFLPDFQALLQGSAYTLWMLSLLPITAQLWGILQRSMKRIPEATTISQEPGAFD